MFRLWIVLVALCAVSLGEEDRVIFVDDYERDGRSSSSSSRKFKSERRAGVAIGTCINIVFGVTMASALLSRLVVGHQAAPSLNVRGSAHILVRLALLSHLGALTTSETGAATFLRRMGRKFRWLLLEFGPVLSSGKVHTRRRLEATREADRCQGRRFGDALVTVSLFVCGLVFVHLVLFAVAGACISSGKLNPRRVFLKLDASLLWPRSLWPFLPFSLFALVVRASRTMAISKCWTDTNGIAWAGLFTILSGAGVLTFFAAKVVRHLPSPSEKSNEKDVESATESSRKRKATFEAKSTKRSVKEEGGLFESQATGRWIETNRDERFVASHGSMFEAYVPDRARIGEFIIAFPQFLSAFIVGISRREYQAQAMLLFTVALCYAPVVALSPLFANNLKNCLELAAAVSNVLVLLFISIAAFHRRNEEGLYAVAAAVEILTLLVVVVIPALLALACLVAYHVVPSLLSPKKSMAPTTTAKEAKNGPESDGVEAMAAATADCSGSDDNAGALSSATDHADCGLVANASGVVETSIAFVSAVARSTTPFPEFCSTFVNLLGYEIVHLGRWTIMPYYDAFATYPPNIPSSHSPSSIIEEDDEDAEEIDEKRASAPPEYTDLEYEETPKKAKEEHKQEEKKSDGKYDSGDCEPAQ